MDTISAEDFCSAIYCTTTPAAGFALNAAGEIVVVARVVDAGFEEYYRVLFEGVADLTWHGSDGSTYAPRPDDLFEFAAIEIASTPSGWQVSINPWYSSVVDFHCAQIRMNGARVVGTGKWFRDDLPDRLPRVPAFPKG